MTDRTINESTYREALKALDDMLVIPMRAFGERTKKANIVRAAIQAATGDWQQYAKEGENAQQCIERHRREQDSLLKLLAEARAALPRGEEPTPDQQQAGGLPPEEWAIYIAWIIDFYLSSENAVRERDRREKAIAGIIGRRIKWLMPATPPLAPSGVAGKATDERAAFEKRMHADGWRDFNGRWEKGWWFYDLSDLNARWIGWQRRTEVATPPAAAGAAIPVLNALEVLECVKLLPSYKLSAANFLRILGERGMWVIKNPLAASPAPASGEKL